MSTDEVCYHNKFGFCKHGDRCWKKHICEICENKSCSGGNECNKRHPRKCKFFQDYRRCKFGEYCAFDHSDPNNAAEKEVKLLKKKLEDLEKTIEVKNAEIKDILVILNRIETNIESLNNENSNLKVSINSQIRLSSSSQTSRPSLSVITANSLNTSSNNTMNEENIIPQLDGCHSEQVLNCENCETTFETDDQLQKHMQEHEWGCDDCKLCCTSKYFVDLHELEHHGDTPDSIRYIRDDIPESTKKLFAAGHRLN